MGTSWSAQNSWSGSKQARVFLCSNTQLLGHPLSLAILSQLSRRGEGWEGKLFILGFQKSVAQLVKNPPANAGDPVRFLGREDTLEKGLATHCGILGFPGGSAGKESTCNAGELGSIPGLGRSSGEGNGYPLQYSGLKNPMDREPGGYGLQGRKESDMTE